MQLIISQAGFVKFRLPIPLAGVFFVLRTVLKRNQDIPPETKRQMEAWLRRCKPMFKAYRGYRIIEVSEKSGVEIIITL